MSKTTKTSIDATVRTALALIGLGLIVGGVAAWTGPGACVLAGTMAATFAVLWSRAVVREKNSEGGR